MTTKRKSIKIHTKKMSVASNERKSATYDNDFFKWTKSQAKFLKNEEFSKLDRDNLIEEIESLGRSQKDKLKSHLENLLMHMLKVKVQGKGKATTSWRLSIKEASHKAQKALQENPSLKPKLKEVLEDAYFSSRIRAALETKMAEDKFPEECPWGLKEIFPDLEKKYS